MSLNQYPHQTVTPFGCIGFSMYACGFSVPQMRQFYLFTYPPKSKWASSEKMIIFAKIGIFYKSIAGPLSEAYTQPYSFGGRIKLIICQIRHERSVTIHEIIISWKINVRWRTLYNFILYRISLQCHLQNATTCSDVSSYADIIYNGFWLNSWHVSWWSLLKCIKAA